MFGAMSFPTMVRDRMEISIANSCTITLDAGTEERLRLARKRTGLAAQLKGSILALVLFDVCEEIDVEKLRKMSGARRSEPPLKSGPASYVRFERPPVVDTLELLTLTTGERLEGQVKYYDYGVISVVYQMPLSGDWRFLVQLANRWIATVELNLVAAKLKTAGDLYRYMVDEFHQSRTFLPELTVVIILIVELLSVFHVHL